MINSVLLKNEVVTEFQKSCLILIAKGNSGCLCIRPELVLNEYSPINYHRAELSDPHHEIITPTLVQARLAWVFLFFCYSENLIWRKQGALVPWHCLWSALIAAQVAVLECRTCTDGCGTATGHPMSARECWWYLSCIPPSLPGTLVIPDCIPLIPARCSCWYMTASPHPCQVPLSDSCTCIPPCAMWELLLLPWDPGSALPPPSCIYWTILSFSTELSTKLNRIVCCCGFLFTRVIDWLVLWDVPSNNCRQAAVPLWGTLLCPGCRVRAALAGILQDTVDGCAHSGHVSVLDTGLISFQKGHVVLLPRGGQHQHHSGSLCQPGEGGGDGAPGQPQVNRGAQQGWHRLEGFVLCCALLLENQPASVGQGSLAGGHCKRGRNLFASLPRRQMSVERRNKNLFALMQQ